MKRKLLTLLLNVCIVVFMLSAVAFADDGSTWDGKAYPYYLMDMDKPNSESNPYIIDTPGKLAKLSAESNPFIYMKEDGRFRNLYSKRKRPNEITLQYKNASFYVDNSGKYFKMTNDIDLDRIPFNPIYEFNGYFDGDGHVITNMNINVTLENHNYPDEGPEGLNVGLFGVITRVKNLGIGDGSSITVNYKTIAPAGNPTIYVGGIAGRTYNIENCSNKATITVIVPERVTDSVISVYAGGVVGSNYGLYSTIENCTNKGIVLVDSNQPVKAGGITAEYCTIRNNNNFGKVMVTQMNAKFSTRVFESLVGGIAAEGTNIENCSNTGDISAVDIDNNTFVGGIVGRIKGSFVENCYNKGNVTSKNFSNELKSYNGSRAGGIVGSPNTTNIYNCYNTGEVMATVSDTPSGGAGTIAGRRESSDIQFCYVLSQPNTVPYGGYDKSETKFQIYSFTDYNSEVIGLSMAKKDSIPLNTDVTLLQALNKFVNGEERKQFVDTYKLWKADDSNGGYPIFADNIAYADRNSNLALKMVTNTDNTKSNTTDGNDGNFNTRWYALDNKINHWWRVDLGKKYDLRNTEIMFEKPGKVYKYIIETSDDEQNWNIVVDKKNNTDNTQIQKDALNVRQVRYVRVKFTGLESDCSASFYEFKVFESYGTDFAPTIITPILAFTETPSSNITAIPTNSKFLVNGTVVSFDAYNINGNNYFKLRDLAKVASGTNKQFEVTWDDTRKAINLASLKPYTVEGGELAKGDGKAKQYTLSKDKIYKDGSEVSLTAYRIDAYNFFKLRDVGKLFDIGVKWDEATRTVGIDTSLSYTQ